MSGADSLFAEHVFEHLTPTQVKPFFLPSSQKMISIINVPQKIGHFTNSDLTKKNGRGSDMAKTQPK